MFLHTTDIPMVEFRKSEGVATYGKAMFAGKPRGLWYGRDFQWIERMQKYNHWDPVGSISEKGTSKHTLEYYQSVLLSKAVPNAANTNVLRPNGNTTQLHFVYTLPLKPSHFTTKWSDKALDKVFLMSESSFDEILPVFEAYFAKLCEEQAALYTPDLFWAPQQFREAIEGVHYPAQTKRNFDRGIVYDGIERYLASPFVQQKIADYERSLEYLCRTNVLTAAMKKRCPGKAEYATHVVQFKDKYGIALLKAALRGELPIVGIFLELRRIAWGHFFQDVMQKEWGGVEFDASLFQPKYEEIFPSLLYLEAASGCLWHPEILFAGETPELAAILVWGASKGNLPRIEEEIFRKFAEAKGAFLYRQLGLTKRIPNAEVPITEEERNYYLSRLYVAGVNSTNTMKYIQRGKAPGPAGAGAGAGKGGKRMTRRRRH
jgi:hypothetical protein